MNIAFIGVGSNIDAEKNISQMLELLNKEVKILKISSFITTKPIGIENQPDFTNGTLKIETPLKQQELKSTLIKIEDKLGRNRNAQKFGPRTMDLDIIIWNGEIVDDDYYSRDFIYKSIDEIK